MPSLRPIAFLAFASACFGSASSQAPSSPPAAVEVGRAIAGPLADAWTFLGEVRAMERAELAAGASGTVVQLTVREGDPIQPGQTLAVVDRALVSARYERAAAAETEAAEDLAQAQRVIDRLERVKTGVIAPSELEDAQSRVAALTARHAALRAATREAGAELARHSVRAPFAGIVTGRHVDPGDWVTPGQPVLDVVSVDAVEVRVSVSRELAARVHPDDPVTIVGQTDVPGVIAGVVPALDPASRTGLVRVSPAGSAPWLLPGAPVEVRFPVNQDAEGTVVPRDALVLGPAGNRVVRVVDGKAEPVDVQVIASNADAALVSGVEVGDVIVVRGNERLRPGQAVAVAVAGAPAGE